MDDHLSSLCGKKNVCIGVQTREYYENQPLDISSKTSFNKIRSWYDELSRTRRGETILRRGDTCDRKKKDDDEVDDVSDEEELDDEEDDEEEEDDDDEDEDDPDVLSAIDEVGDADPVKFSVDDKLL